MEVISLESQIYSTMDLLLRRETSQIDDDNGPSATHHRASIDIRLTSLGRDGNNNLVKYARDIINNLATGFGPDTKWTLSQNHAGYFVLTEVRSPTL